MKKTNSVRTDFKIIRTKSFNKMLKLKSNTQKQLSPKHLGYDRSTLDLYKVNLNEIDLKLKEKQQNSEYHTKSQINVKKILDHDFNSNIIKILVVDDDRYCRESVQRIVSIIMNQLCEDSKFSYEITKASDGLDTLNSVVEDQIINSNIKLIISDENMKYINGSDSFYLLNKLFNLGKLNRIPMFILTALEDPETLQYIQESSNANEILKKPVNKKVLKEKICKYFDGKEFIFK